MKTEEVPNHRTRVAAEKREKTRARLLESALLVFAQKGPQAAVIDDVIAHAGMARGSFYNYFKTNEDLLAAVATEVSNELLRLIDPIVQQRTDPAERIASGARLLLHAIAQNPLLGAFLSRLPLPSAGSSLVGIDFLARDIAAGIANGSFGNIGHKVALDLAVGVLFSAAHALSREALAADYPEAIVQAMLLGLGLKGAVAARIVALPLPELELADSSILKRSQDANTQ